MELSVDITSYYDEQRSQESIKSFYWAINQDKTGDTGLFLKLQGIVGQLDWDKMSFQEKLELFQGGGADAQTAELMIGFYNWNHSKEKIDYIISNYRDCDADYYDAQCEIARLQYQITLLQSQPRKSNKNNDDGFSGGFFTGRLWG
jgi:glutamate synthase domain-containing protein 1